MKLTSKITLLLGAAAIAVAAAVPDDVHATSSCWKACLVKIGAGLNPPCDNAECACSRAGEFDGPADTCVRKECPSGDLQEMYCAACNECDPPYRCERCPSK